MILEPFETHGRKKHSKFEIGWDPLWKTSYLQYQSFLEEWPSISIFPTRQRSSVPSASSTRRWVHSALWACHDVTIVQLQTGASKQLKPRVLKSDTLQGESGESDSFSMSNLKWHFFRVSHAVSWWEWWIDAFSRKSNTAPGVRFAIYSIPVGQEDGHCASRFVDPIVGIYGKTAQDVSRVPKKCWRFLPSTIGVAQNIRQFWGTICVKLPKDFGSWWIESPSHHLQIRLLLGTKSLPPGFENFGRYARYVCVCVKRFANWRLKDWGYLRTSINHEKPLQCAQKTWIFHLKLNSFQSQIFGFQGAKKKKNNCGPEAMDWPTRCQLVIRDAVKGIP